MDTELEVPRGRMPKTSLDLWLPELQGSRARAEQARACRTLLSPGQGLTTRPRARMSRLAGVYGVGRNAPQMPAPSQSQEARLILDSIREERVGTLARLVGYLEENGVVEGRPKTFEERHVMQKYTYLANAFGEPPHYEFDFLENGAYSASLALDLYAEGRDGVGVTPFRNNADAGSVFVQMVQGRGKRTLQAMTFAMRDIREGVERDEFVDTMHRERSLYERRLLEWAFDRVSESIGRLGAEDG